MSSERHSPANPAQELNGRIALFPGDHEPISLPKNALRAMSPRQKRAFFAANPPTRLHLPTASDSLMHELIRG